MERTQITLFLVGLIFLLSDLTLSQSDDAINGLQFTVPQHIQALNEQIRVAESNEDWQLYYQLREELIQSWQQINPDVAKLYRNANDGKADTTPDGMPANHPRKNIGEPNKSILFETPAQSKVLWGDDLMVANGRFYDISMDISRDDEIYLAVAGRLDGSTTQDSAYIYKSTDGGMTWTLWVGLGTTTQTFEKIEIMCFD